MLNNKTLALLSNAIKSLTLDAIEQANSGHPGMPLGFADVMTVLAAEFLRFNPQDPKWAGRDRLILSAGHGSMLLYAFYYLSGYKNFTLEDIKNFRKIGSKAAGHPEHELYEAIETTTGPLGQGLANAVGMAVAAKKRHSALEPKMLEHKIYAIVGDGCLMEGISYEAASLAGHLKLDNLIILFDSNNITIDGEAKIACSEDHQAKFAAFGFECFSANGHDSEAIRDVLQQAQISSKPVFIEFKTEIGMGLNKLLSGTNEVHGKAVGANAVQQFKNDNNLPLESFMIAAEAKSLWEKLWLRNEGYYQNWHKQHSDLSNKHFQDFKNQDLGALLHKLDNLPQELSGKNEATRVSGGRVTDIIRSFSCNIVGSADLAGSTNLKPSGSQDLISLDNFKSDYLAYGIREHAMGAIMNGIALEGFQAIGSTFFVFSDYMRPSIRLAALMNLPNLYLFTHDSIGVGEDGPTHQPIEHLASFRAMPRIRIFRPADAIETIEAVRFHLTSYDRPTILVLTRQSVPQIRKDYNIDNIKSLKGAYIIKDSIGEPEITIFASGSELSTALEVSNILYNLNIRIVSVPEFNLFFEQDKDYIKTILGNNSLKVAIEAASEFGWSKYIGNEGLFFGMQDFGASGPAGDLFEHFNLSAQKIAEVIFKKYGVYA